MWQHPNLVNSETDLGTFTSHKIKLLDMDIHYRRMGKGFPLFLLPSWPMSSIEYLPIASALQNHISLYAIDFPGWGGKSSQMILEPTVNNYAKIVQEWVRNFGYKNYGLLGYSLGGLIAQLAITQKEKKLTPKKVVYVSTLHSGNDIKKEKQFWLSAYTFADRIGVSDKIIHAFLSKILKKTVEETDYYKQYKDHPIFQDFTKDIANWDISAIMSALLSTIGSDYLSTYTKDFESLVVYADQDPSFIQKGSLEIAKKIGITPIVIDNADHNHFGFDVNKSAMIILNFLLA